MNLVFDAMYGYLVLGLNRGGGHFLNFFVAHMILYCKKVCFSRLMRVYIVLIVMSAMYLVHVSLLLIGQQGL
jgi:hypothetical protein